MGARIPLPRSLNIEAWERLTLGIEDKQLVDFLRYGFPLGYEGPPIGFTAQNHSSATNFPRDIDHYIQTELNAGAIIGPFEVPPFTPWAKCSPLMTRPKKGSEFRRVILDLSYGDGTSVNYYTPKDSYLGIPTKLQLPSIDNIRDIIKNFNGDCYLYTTDISRAYRNIPICPSSYPLLNFSHDGKVYTDISAPFGARWSCLHCQRITDAVRFILRKRNVTVLNYLDDFCGIAPNMEEAQQGYEMLISTLAELGLPEATHKRSPPSRQAQWLGFKLDMDTGLITIPTDKIERTIEALTSIKHKSHIPIKHLRSILGKLLHISQCSYPARLFLNRMLATLRATSGNMAYLDAGFHLDLQWFLEYLPGTNGKYLIEPVLEPDSAIYCLVEGTSVQACRNGHFYNKQLPPASQAANPKQAHRQALNCLVSIKAWLRDIAHTTVKLHCTDKSVVTAISSAKGRDQGVLSPVRELWRVAGVHKINVHVTHSTEMVIKQQLDKACNAKDINEYMFKLQSNL